MLTNIFLGVLVNLLFVSSCFAVEEFHVFDVGQGSCSLAVYKGSKIGFLFDGGSKNSKTISKVSQFQTEEEFAVFAKKKKQTISLEQDINFFSLIEEAVRNETTPQKPIVEQYMSFQTSAKKDTRISSIREKIKNKIEEYNLKILFVLLSHPDEDHINLIAKKYKSKQSTVVESIIPDNIPVEAFLGGDWVNHDTEDTQAVIAYLKERKANINFPYYWRYEGSLLTDNVLFKFESQNNKYIQLRGIILNDIDKEKAKELLSLKCAPMYTSTKIINTFFKYSPTMLDVVKVLYGENDFQYPDFRKDLENVYFRSLGAETNDLNSQSLIISFRMPSLKAIITCTGDAESVTFSSIKEINPNLPFQEEHYLKAVVIPHHGSLKNFSGKVITSLNPDLFFVSTGLTSYDHPSANALLAYEKSVETTSNFWKKYIRTENILLNMSIVRTGKTDKDYKLMPFNRVPVLSTNLLGNVNWRDSSINVSYSSILEEKDDRYLVDVSNNIQHLLEELKQLPELKLTEEGANQIKMFSETINHFGNISNSLSFTEEKFPLILTTENQFSYAVVQKSNKEFRLYNVKKI